MGKEAEIIGFGPFSEDITQYLTYPKEWYGNIAQRLTHPENKIENLELTLNVVVFLFQCPTNSTSELLAEALNVNPDDPSTYQIKNENVNFDLLHELENRTFCIEHTEGLKMLLNKNFTLFYEPNA